MRTASRSRSFGSCCGGGEMLRASPLCFAAQDLLCSSKVRWLALLLGVYHEDMEQAALFGMDLPELKECLGAFTHKAPDLYRALYWQRMVSLDQITDLPQAMMEDLRAKGSVVGHPEIVQTATSTDGTERYLVRMSDGLTVETVWMPDQRLKTLSDNDDGQTEKVDQRNRGSLAKSGVSRATICVSSQVGCAVNCRFCLTAKLWMNAQSDGGRDRGPGGRGSESAPNTDRQGSYQFGLYGYG